MIRSKIVTLYAPDQARKYPWLGKSIKGGWVVLFTGPKTGVCIVGSPDSASGVLFGTTGLYGNIGGWNEEAYEPFYGSIVIQSPSPG